MRTLVTKQVLENESAALGDLSAASVLELEAESEQTLSVIAACALIYLAKTLDFNLRYFVENCLNDCFPTEDMPLAAWLTELLKVVEQAALNRQKPNLDAAFRAEILYKVAQHSYLHNYGTQQVLLCTSAFYPRALKEISAYPPILFFRGLAANLCHLNRYPSICVVGSRKMTAYGRRVVNKLLSYLSLFNVQIVSGLAYGCDAQAHQAALQNNLRTIAVLPASLDCCYPQEHASLLAAITQNGLAFSEFMPNTPAQARYFAARNRLLSGLSQVCVVIESDRKGGSLITANFALKQNRELLAVPGLIDAPLSRGCNNLILEGATPLLQAEQIAELLQNISYLQAWEFSLQAKTCLAELGVSQKLGKQATDTDRALLEPLLNSNKDDGQQLQSVAAERNLSKLICALLRINGALGRDDLFAACKEHFADLQESLSIESFLACLQLLDLLGKVTECKGEYALN